MSTGYVGRFERTLEQLQERIRRGGDPAAFDMLARLVRVRAHSFLMGAAIGLDSEAALGVVPRWILEIGAGLGTAPKPLHEWFSSQCERMIDEYFADAARLQQHLYCAVPKLPPGLDVAVRIRPAQRLSGDFVAVRRQGDHVVFAVGDVTSHGTAAAAFGALVLPLLHDAARGQGLLELAFSLDSSLRAAKCTGTRVPATIGLWNRHTGDLQVLNCGAPLALLVTGGAVRATNGGGFPFGWCQLPAAGFEAWQESVGAGDSLIVVSDGVVEQRSADGSDFGMERLMRLAGRMPAAGAAVLVDAIFKAVDEFAQSRPQEDDQTALVLRFG